MSLSLLEILANADFNLNNNGALGAAVASSQVHNVFVLLEKGYDIDADFDTIMNGIENVADVPYFKNKLNSNNK